MSLIHFHGLFPLNLYLKSIQEIHKRKIFIIQVRKKIPCNTNRPEEKKLPAEMKSIKIKSSDIL
jgi:hypothetical protein